MYLCTYVRMYVHTYVRMYVHTYVRMYVCMYVCMYVRMYMYVYDDIGSMADGKALAEKFKAIEESAQQPQKEVIKMKCELISSAVKYLADPLYKQLVDQKDLNDEEKQLKYLLYKIRKFQMSCDRDIRDIIQAIDESDIDKGTKNCEKDDYFMGLAQLTALRSHDPSSAVGHVILSPSFS